MVEVLIVIKEHLNAPVPFADEIAGAFLNQAIAEVVQKLKSEVMGFLVRDLRFTQEIAAKTHVK